MIYIKNGVAGNSNSNQSTIIIWPIWIAKFLMVTCHIELWMVCGKITLDTYTTVNKTIRALQINKW